MLRVGLTGGLASGKSTVAAMFRDLGALHVDADLLAREAIEPGGAAHDAVVARFGPRIVAAGGSIDRKALARIVFDDGAALADLNAIVHPRVREAIAAALARAQSGDHPPAIAILDVPLLVEAGLHRDLDAVVLVACSPESQVRRAVARGGMSEAEARARIAAQAPLETKRAVADYVIDTETSLDETRRQVDEIVRSLGTRR